MANAIAIFVCDDAVKAETARQLLLSQHFTAGQISVEQSGFVSYDAKTHSSGTSDTLLDKFVVIGRK